MTSYVNIQSSDGDDCFQSKKIRAVSFWVRITATQVPKNGVIFIRYGAVTRCIWGFLQTWPSKQVIKIINFWLFSTIKQPWCTPAILQSVNHIAQQQRNRRINPFIADLMWVKWSKDLCKTRKGTDPQSSRWVWLLPHTSCSAVIG